MKYHVKENGQVRGPFAPEELREMKAAREIDDSTMFRASGTEHWLAAVDMESELAGDPPALPVAAVRAATAGAMPMPLLVQRVEVTRIEARFADVLALVFKVVVSLVILSPLIMFALFVLLAVLSAFGAVLLSPSFVRGFQHGVGTP